MDPNLTAYPQFKKNYSATELERCFTPTFEEKLLVEEHAQSDFPVHSLIFMLLLKCYQCLGRPVAFKKIPDGVKEHIAQHMHQENQVLLQASQDFPRTNRKRYLEYIRHHLGINIDDRARKKLIIETIETHVKIRNDAADVINAVLDVLIKSHFELPALHQLVRQVNSALHKANETFYHLVNQQRSEKAKAAIELLLKPPSNGGPSEWFSAKQEIAQPTLKKTKEFIHQFQKLDHLKSMLPVNTDFIPPAKLTTFYHEAASIDADILKQMKPHKRYALVALYINHKAALTLDDFCHVLTRWMNQIHHSALELLNQYRIDHANDTDEMIDTLHSMLKTLKTEEKPDDKIDQLMKDIPKEGDIDSMMEKCERHQIYSDNNYYPFALKLYQNKRSGLLDLLEHLDLQSAYHDSPLLNAAKTILLNRHGAKKLLPLTNNQDTYPVFLDLMPEKIKKIAVDNENDTINRHYYELGIFTELLDEMNCGDIFILGAYDFNDPNVSLISRENFEKNVDNYCHIAQLEKNKKVFVLSLQKLLAGQADTTDQNFPHNEFLHMVNKKPYIKKTKTEEKSAHLDALSNAIDNRMTPITIIDVIRDVDQWVGLSRTLKTSSGQKVAIEDIAERFSATLYAYGCNVGPVQTAFSLNAFSRKQVASLFNYYLSEPRIEAMLTRVVNYYHRFVLPKYWGDGSSVSVDGSYWEMYTSNLLAAHHIRYGKYGGLGYYHVSDQYIALYSNFLTCGVHEGSYLMDGIIENLSEIQPCIVHGDTGAQSEIVFALCFLLGIKLMPRIKHLKHLRYYKTHKSDAYDYIDDIFSSHRIDWNKIEEYYHDMLKVAMSIQQGTIKASTILRKFNAKNKKNKLYYAFRELGRVVRTTYLLHYMDDVQTRKMVHAGTCKSEEFNAFLDWVSFGNNKVIRDNRKNAQRKIIKCGHLVANIVMTHVVVTMTRAINQLRDENYPIEEDSLKRFSPYRTSHMNRLGIFIIDKNRQAAEPVFDLVK